MFCFSYMAGFGEAAAPSTQDDWLLSSLFSVFLDLVAFEVVPGFVMGCLGATSFSCRMKCLLYLIFASKCLRRRSYV